MEAVEKISTEVIGLSAGSGQRGMTARVVRGSVWSLGGQTVTLAASLIATPFVIRMLGTEAYGVLTLINVMIGYLAFADLGMATASTRFGAEAFARQSEDEEAAVVWTSLAALAPPTLLAAVLLTLTAETLVEDVLRLPVQLIGPAAFALRLAAIGFIARNLAGALNTPQLVRMRLDLFTLINTAGAVGQIALVPVALLWGGGVVTAAAVVAGASVIMAAAHAVASARLLRRIIRPRINVDLIGPMLRFGAATAVLTIAGLALMNAEKLLVARLTSVSVLAYYSVAFTVARMLAFLPGAVSQPLLPAFSRLQSAADREPLQLLYARAVRGLLLWMVPAAVLIAVGARPVLTVWAGEDYGRESAVPLYILLAGCVFDGLSYVPRMLLSAAGKPGLIVKYQLINLVPYVLVAIALIIPFGAAGAAAAWSLRATLEALMMFRGARVHARVSLFAVSVAWRGYLAAAVVLLLPLLMMGLTSLTAAAAAGICISALLAYGAIVWALVLTREERNWLNELLRGRFSLLIRS